jgi:hypothetical protein
MRSRKMKAVRVYPNPGTVSNKYPSSHPVKTACTIQTQPVNLPIGFLRTNNKKNNNQRIPQAAQHRKEKDLDNQLLPCLDSLYNYLDFYELGRISRLCSL